MKNEKTITFCPNCRKPVEANEYFTTDGVSDWRAATSVGVTIRCTKCDYSGLALRASIEDYEKLMKLIEKREGKPKIRDTKKGKSEK